MTNLHRYALVTAVCVSLAGPPVASAILVPIEPGKPTPAEKQRQRQVVRKAKPQAPRHVLPVRNKPALQP